MLFAKRTALLLRPREPYFRWAATIQGRHAHADRPDRGRLSVYVLSEDITPEAHSGAIDGYRENVFCQQLERVTSDRTRWPADRGRLAFEEWFAMAIDVDVWELRPAPGEVPLA
jgi:hypothetical protein